MNFSEIGNDIHYFGKFLLIFELGRGLYLARIGAYDNPFSLYNGKSLDLFFRSYLSSLLYSECSQIQILPGLEISENRHLPCITKNIGIYGGKFNFQYKYQNFHLPYSLSNS